MLVFWLGAVAGKVAFLIIIKTRDFTNVTPLFLFLWDIGDVDISGRSLLFPLPSVFPLLTPEPHLLILLVVLFRWLCRIVTWWGWFRILGFGFFEAGQVLRALGLHLWKSVVRQAVAPGATSIRVLNHSAGSLACFGLYIYYSLHYLFKASWYSVLLFHFDLDRGFEVFPKIADYSQFIWDPNTIKLC